jgi:hypothetical protein
VTRLSLRSFVSFSATERRALSAAIDALAPQLVDVETVYASLAPSARFPRLLSLCSESDGCDLGGLFSTVLRSPALSQLSIGVDYNTDGDAEAEEERAAATALPLLIRHPHAGSKLSDVSVCSLTQLMFVGALHTGPALTKLYLLLPGGTLEDVLAASGSEAHARLTKLGAHVETAAILADFPPQEARLRQFLGALLNVMPKLRLMELWCSSMISSQSLSESDAAASSLPSDMQLAVLALLHELRRGRNVTVRFALVEQSAALVAALSLPPPQRPPYLAALVPRD